MCYVCLVQKFIHVSIIATCSLYKACKIYDKSFVTIIINSSIHQQIQSTLWFNSYAPKLVPICYYRDKTQGTDVLFLKYWQMSVRFF